MSKENKTTKAVRESILEAVHKGENLSRKIGAITKEKFNEAMVKSEPTREKVENISKAVTRPAFMPLSDHNKGTWPSFDASVQWVAESPPAAWANALPSSFRSSSQNFSSQARRK